MSRATPQLESTERVQPNAMLGGLGSPIGGSTGSSSGQQELLHPDPDEANLLPLRILPGVEERLQQPANLVLQLLLAGEGSLAGPRPAHGEESGKAYGDGHGAKGLEALGDEPAEHGGGEVTRPPEDEDGIEGVHFECLLLPDRLALPFVRDGIVREPARLAMEILASLAEPLPELGGLEAPQLGDELDALLVEEPFRLRPDAGNHPDRESVEEALHLVGTH